MRRWPAGSHPLALALTSATRDVPARGVSSVVGWWERRRLLYNAAVGVAGLATMAVLGVAFAASQLTANPWPVPEPTFAPVFMVVLYGVAANICYTSGWFVQLAVRAVGGDESGSLAPWAFRAGLVFSIAVTLLPALIGLVALVASLVRW